MKQYFSLLFLLSFSFLLNMQLLLCKLLLSSQSQFVELPTAL